MTRTLFVILILGTLLGAPLTARCADELDLIYRRTDRIGPAETGTAPRTEMSLREARRLADAIRTGRKTLARPGDGKEAPLAPFSVLLREAAYRVVVEGEAAKVHAEIELATAGEFPHDLSIDLGEVALERALLDGAAATVLHGGRSGAFRLRLPAEGRHVLSLDFLVGLHESRNVTSLQFNVPRVPRSRVEAVLPGRDLDVDLLPAAAARVVPGESSTRVEGLLKYGGTVYLRWIARNGTQASPEPEEERVEEKTAPLVYDVTALQSWQVEGVMATGRARFDIDVKSGELSALRFRLPGDVQVLDVAAPHLADWSQSRDGKDSRVDLRLKRQAKGTVQVQITMARILAAFDPGRKGATGVAFPIPNVRNDPTEGRRNSEKGHVLVDVRDEVEIETAPDAELTPVDPAEIPRAPGASRPGALAFKYIVPAWRHELRLVRHEELATPTTQVVSADWGALLDGRGMVAVLGELSVKNDARQYLRLRLPAGARFGGAVVDGKAVVSGRGETEQEVLVPLARSKGTAPHLQAFPLQVAYLMPLGTGRGLVSKIELPLPRLDLPVDRILWTVHGPEERVLTQSGGDLRQLRDSEGVLQNLYGAGATVLRAGGRVVLALLGAPFMTFSRGAYQSERSMRQELSKSVATRPGRAQSPRRDRRMARGAGRKKARRLEELRSEAKEDAFREAEVQADEEGGAGDDSMDLDAAPEPQSMGGFAGAPPPAPAEKAPQRSALLDLMSRSQSLQGAVPVEPRLSPLDCRSTVFCRELVPAGENGPELRLRVTAVDARVVSAVNLVILLAATVLLFALPIRRRLMGRVPAMLLFVALLALMGTLAHYLGNDYRAFWEGLGIGCMLRAMRWAARRIIGV